MGCGDIADDFSDDNLLVDFLNKISAKEKDQKVTLVLNGDIFDFLKMHYKNTYPRYITEEISLWKLEHIISAHQEVFEALKIFLNNQNHSIHFVIGNHDADLAWPDVQRKIQEKLNCKERATFDHYYKTEQIHAEHGHEQDPFFAKDPSKPIIKYGGKEILNLPWGSYACFSHLNHIKRKFPKEECMYPNPLALKSNPEYHKESRNKTYHLAFKSFLLDPIIHIGDPTYHVPYIKFAKHILKYGLEIVDDEKFLSQRIKEVMRTNPDKKIIVLGHAHVLNSLNHNQQKAFVTDTWRNEYNLLNNGTKKTKSYVEIEYKDKDLVGAELKEWKQ